ncbi:phosphonate C-P lyase system protein PhnH (plasmid) [Photobacterium sp. DA100]|uniref:phosphonate C-P lyase system protein PhnH n=1 Tax=Photobacterium sp. DA100 TaxID=3027472 RepID=UPI00247863D1|nr:phosphonate C-P lyase system protein PhnH [Photobacterium sp. DA100]WEM44149.1 phosphonate C-P lyase system protein PhnH [Photobacterium sp. DA100]
MSHITSAFRDAVHDSQFCFRRLLKAMSEPGTIVELDRCQGFGTMMPATGQVLLAMADNSTPLWLSPAFMKDKAAKQNIHFHTGASTNATTGKASFAAIALADMPVIKFDELAFNVGNEEYPDRSTTIVIETDGFFSGQQYKLTGPGIKDEQYIQLGELSSVVKNALLVQGEVFPLGLDLIFVSGEQVVAIPRSTSVEAV